MKSLRIFSIALLTLACASIASAQSKTETFKVNGNCTMCKSKIEKAAKDAGAFTAVWNVDSKILAVSYKTSSTNTAKIQKKISSVGYDNEGVKGSDDAYNKLHACCQYDRTVSLGSSDTHQAKTDCCKKDEKCTKEGKSGKSCCNSSAKQ